MTAIFMGEDPWENYCAGLAAAEKSIECYCMSDMMIDSVPDNMHLFGKAECLGRWYWQYHPLLLREKTVVLIGCGKYGSALLERALLTNVYTPDRTVEYHVFEDEAGVHVRLSEEMPGVQSFGRGEQILTREYVMKDALNRQAVMMNDIYNRGSSSPTKWEDLSYFLKQSNIAAADHLLVKIRYLLGDETITAITPENCRRAYEVYRSTREMTI